MAEYGERKSRRLRDATLAALAVPVFLALAFALIWTIWETGAAIYALMVSLVGDETIAAGLGCILAMMLVVFVITLGNDNG